jgi:hypothetical protein
VRKVWIVMGGEYSGKYVEAVCSSYEQACGVAVMNDLYEDGAVEMWEPDDEIPPFKLLHTCIVRPGRDSTRPIDVDHGSRPVAVDYVAEPRVVETPTGYLWVRAEGYPTAEEAEAAARAAYDQRNRRDDGERKGVA